jgi:hypothetical protein
MVRACSTYGREAKLIQNFDWKNVKGGDHLEDLGIDGRKLVIICIAGTVKITVF